MCKNSSVQRFLCGKDPVLTQKNLYTQTAQIFLQTDFLHAETVAIAVFTQQKLFSTEAFTHQKKMQSSSYRQTVFLHRKFSAQKSYAQKVLRTTFFTYRRFYVLIDTNCRQKLVHTARVYTANFYTERLRFPFLITYFLDTECFSFWKPWFGIFWTCPAWLITNTLKLRPALRWRQRVAHYGTYIEDLFYCTY